jgi:hypothetical protein
MSHHLPGAGGEGVVAGVAGESFTAPPGSEGLGAIGGADEVLPFTGSVFSLPVAVTGVVLTLGGWLLTRVAIERVD